jgi:beta-N-acetylhexosaminidase
MLQKIGPVMLDLAGTVISQEEQEILQHPLVGGVILFSRNYETPEQLALLCHAIRAVRSTPLLIAVDQEGGRVQRFKHGFTLLPSMGMIGKWYEQNKNQAILFAQSCGWLMASELLSVGLDFSFAPVLDLNKVANPAIGDRAFHCEPEIVIQLAKAWIEGMHKAGMAATGKHFPGHGAVTVDSHVSLPIDTRSMPEIQQDDLRTFEALIPTHLDAIMPAHIVFSEIDDKPVGFSSYWLRNVLRQHYGFKGVIFSDDLNMHGAACGGDYNDRANAALLAGCDMVLICNNRVGALSILDNLSEKYLMPNYVFKKMQVKSSMVSFQALKKSIVWQEAQLSIVRFFENIQTVN